MRPRNLFIAILALVIGAGASLLPGLAAGGLPTTAHFSAVDFAWQVSGGTATSVTIAQGANVALDYPSGGYHHNADFAGGPTPASCTPGGPPVPAVPTAQGWSGSCTFNTPGVYTFHCDMHPYMQGTINVADSTGGVPGTTPATTPTTPTTTPSTPGTTTISPVYTVPGYATPGGTIPEGTTPGAPRASFSLLDSQRGSRIRGTVTVATAGSRVVVDISAPTASLARAKKQASVSVGHFVRASSPAGAVRFSVALSARAKRALRKHHRLALGVAVTVTPPGAAAQRLAATTELKG